MRDFKIFQLIRTFTDEEWSEFILFVSSAYFNKSRDYSEILKNLKNFLNNKIELDKINTVDFYHKIFPGKKYNNKTLRNRLNELTKLCEKYIIHKTLEKESLLKQKLLLQGFFDKKLYKIFVREYEKKPENHKEISSKQYTTSEIMFLRTIVSRENRNFNEMFDNLSKQIEYMLSFFLEHLFEGAVEYEFEKLYNVNPNVNLLFDIISNLNTVKLIKTLEERNETPYLLLIIYYYMYKSLSEINNDDLFNKLQNLFFKNINLIDNKVKDRLLGYMISYYFVKINTGKAEYLKNVFRLYLLKLKFGLISDLKEIRYPSSAYRDYIVVGIRLKKYKWVENFIKKYSIELPDEIREEETNMAYSRLYFSKKDFNKAIEMLNRVKTSNYLYALDAMRAKLRIYYEMSEFEEAFLEIDRVRHYIKNNTKKIARSVRLYTKEFLDKYSALLRLRLSPDKNELIYLAPQIYKSLTLVSKEWFIEKIKEIELYHK